MPSPRFSATNQPPNRGRKKGARDKVSQKVIDAAPEIVDAMIEQAKAGCTQSQATLMKYAAPAIKPRGTLITFPLPPKGSPVSERAEAVIEAVSKGLMPVETGTQLLGGLASCLKIREMESLQRRVDELEGIVLHRHKHFDGSLHHDA